MAGTLFGFNWLEWSRPAFFLKEQYPAEIEKLTTQTGYGGTTRSGVSDSPSWAIPPTTPH